MSNARQTMQWPMPPLAAGRDAEWQTQLEGVASRARACTSCELCKTRNKVVFGVGTAAIPLVFVGEAPGADEDRQGIPFVGRAGQLLTRIISAIGLEREEVYICNVLKCRPPGNRNPAPDEIVQCSPFLREQLEILKPKVICTLGLFASQFLLDTKVPIGRLRGRVSEYRGIPVVPTYHPAALLRDPSLKSAVWEDVQLMRRILDA
jgi:uracil-DNA glycosylase family 4